ncbi:MAG: threonine synthase [Desulfotignum sp.]|nr:threonine synthase [Desulfotignum sp.]MCF8139137.1 threonine synthase [Desulfotignum sp.]
MISYVSTRGGVLPQPFDEAVLQGFAQDGGLFVPETIPTLSMDQLAELSRMDYPDLAAAILSLFIDPSVIPETDLARLAADSFSSFDQGRVVELVPLNGDSDLRVMELFHGPTLSFKDIAMGFLIRTMDYLLQKRGDRVSIVLATTGDTGPAAAHAAANRLAIDCWPLYPKGMITREQELQMTTLSAGNIHPVAVENCPDGGDDLDLVVAALFADPQVKARLRLSSVNSINWCRVMVQAIHYFYGYFRACDTLGDPVVFSVPSGAFGNLFAGYLAKSMGLPVTGFVCANNVNNALSTALSTGVFEKRPLRRTVSSAIDIVVPYNFWRFLYFLGGSDPEKINDWMTRFQTDGRVRVAEQMNLAVQQGFSAVTVSDADTLATIRQAFTADRPYLLDPHGAVAVAAAREAASRYPAHTRMVCLATAHPAKFPDIITRALNTPDLPAPAVHPSLEQMRTRRRHVWICDREDLAPALIRAMEKHTP